ncbi:protein EMBRYONIC FLOWER 1-like isoform X2 [Chenopodium quinoa]|uniref:protein EMBRYONIC FLOWER 1-like isoform X2 n=1 Tax=Chenopodium quinoa TaxID=63459 RepID=UPI000B77CBD7|nr:protein EMBRYONIC FLOWER 1-like isoform X2 [Chenopodium quinoa]
MASAVGELNPQSDSSLATKSTKPRAPMDVLPLNSPTAEKNDEVTANCSHFSIRGYVSEVRKRDPKLCYPFSLKDSTEPLSMELPPMIVPKFKWWKCVSCVPETGVDDKKAHETEENANTSVSLVGQFSKVNASSLRNAEANTSIDSNNNRNYSPFNVCADPKGKGKAHVEDEPTFPSAWKNGFLKDSSQENFRRTNGEIEVTLATSSKAVELGSRCNGDAVINDLQKGNRVEVFEAGPSQGYANHNGKYAIESCQVNTQASSEDRRAELATNDMGVEVAGLANGPINDRRVRVVNLPDLNECSGEPLCDENIEPMITNSGGEPLHDENIEPMVTNSGGEPPNDENIEPMITNSNNDVLCEDDDDYLGAERRKNPKVRFLSDLLGLNETQSSSRGRKKNPSVTNSLDENVKRKKVGSQDEGSKSIDIRVSNNGTKKVTETTEISKPDSEYAADSDDVSTEVISKALEKRRCKSRIPLQEKRNKKSKLDHDGSSSLSRQKIMSRSAGNGKGKSSEILPGKSDYSDQLIERSSVMTKKRGKLHQPRKEAGSVIPCKNRNTKDSAATQKDVDAEKISAQKDQISSENVYPFSRNYLIKRNCQACDLPGENGLSLSSSQAEPMLVDGSSLRKHQDNRNNVGEASVDSRTIDVSRTPHTGNPFDGNGERSIGAKTNLKGKQAMTPEAEEGSSLARDMRLQVTSSDVNQRAPTNEVRGRVHDIDINSIPTDDKVTEQGDTDEIPMDIVLLLAKNQHERKLGKLDDRKEKQHNPSPSGSSGRCIRDNGTNGSYGESWQKFGQPHFLSMQTPLATDARSSMVNGNAGHIPDLNRNSQSVPSCLPRENPVSARFLSLSQGQEHGPPYPTCDLTLNNWNGTINLGATQRYPPSFLQAVESYRLGPSAPRQNTTDASSVWPSVVTRSMPLGIANPQMIPQGSNALNKGKLHHQTSGSILNFNASAAASRGKQQSLNFSNGYSVGESSAKMHNAKQMQNATLSLGPQNMVRPASSRQPFMENGRTPDVQDNSRHPCYPAAIPTALPFSPSFQSDGSSIGRNNNAGFAGHIPLTLQGQRNMESSHFALQSGVLRPQRQQMDSPLQNGRDISVISRPSYVNPLQGMTDAAPNFLRRGNVRCEERAVAPIPERLVCRLNQNPSELSVEVMNDYMIGPSELRPRGTHRERPAKPRGDAKRQVIRHNRPNPSGKEREKQRKL